MKKEQQRIAIAEACGLNTKKEVCGGVFVYRDTRGFPVASLPDYPNDLNAMHRAEETLSMDDLLAFDRHLYDLLHSQQRCVHATAAQRAEAFLRALNKWST